MKNSPSRKHHYLPRYYLKGFVEAEGAFFVYDKMSGKFHKATPDSAFFENNLNTVELLNGKKSDFLERMYADYEREFWPVLDRIRNSTYSNPIKPFDRMHLFWFLLMTHWRLPSNFQYIDDLAKDFFKENNDLDFYNIRSRSRDDVPKELIDRIRKEPSFKKTARMIITFAPFFKDADWAKRAMEWKFLYSGDGNQYFIVGDNPVITLGNKDHDPVRCLRQFMFPVSGRLVVISDEADTGEELPPEFTIQFNIAIIERARRFVASQNRGFLEAMIGQYQIYANHKKTGLIIPELFNILANEY